MPNRSGTSQLRTILSLEQEIERLKEDIDNWSSQNFGLVSWNIEFYEAAERIIDMTKDKAFEYVNTIVALDKEIIRVKAGKDELLRQVAAMKELIRAILSAPQVSRGE